MPNYFSRISKQAHARIINLISLNEPCIRLNFLCTQELRIFQSEYGPQQVKYVLSDAHITLHDTLFCYLLELYVYLKQDRTDKLFLRWLLGPFHQVKEGIKEYAGSFALTQALVLAHSRYLPQLHLYELN